MLEWQQHDGGADLHALGALGNGGGHDQWVAQHAINCGMMLRQPNRFEPQLLAVFDLGQEIVEELFLGNLAKIAEQIE